MKGQWEREKKQLLGEKALLQDTAHKLNLQVRNAQGEAKQSAESGKVAQKARISVQAVSLIVPVFQCEALSYALWSGDRNSRLRSSQSLRWSQSSGLGDQSYGPWSPNKTGLNESARACLLNFTALNQ